MRLSRLAAPLCVALAACACAPGTSEQDGRTLTVFAAASLTEVFGGLGERFEEEHPGVTVEFSFAGSSALAEQLVRGASADVFASADTATMDRVVDGVGVSLGPEVFARNTLQIAVPPDNPAGVGSLDDLAADGVAVVLCAEEVPCGAASRTVLEAAGVAVEPVSWEEDVKAALTRVRLGEADAALVYRTDVLSAGGGVLGVDFPESGEAVNDYAIGVVDGGPEPGLAAEWIALVASPEGEKVLTDAGFVLP
ncbi:molybdate ABC transporter substrate-binding protein [Thermobifida cellulosilytica]|uniref:Molybdate-binding protein n=1 Tax=Thermobifida cellulosilytica TB100 TaxID=665004 RepID=A0A147KGG2_THECS|nr:molybdate-binding protein [Thermobifida cellulosilytica TB100]